MRHERRTDAGSRRTDRPRTDQPFDEHPVDGAVLGFSICEQRNGNSVSCEQEKRLIRVRQRDPHGNRTDQDGASASAACRYSY